MNNFKTSISKLHKERLSHGNLHEALGIVGRVDVAQKVSAVSRKIVIHDIVFKHIVRSALP